MAGRVTERNRRLGAALKQARKEADRTQGDGAEALGCSQAMISRMETGTRVPTPDELQALIKRYDPSQALRDEITSLMMLADVPIPSGLSLNPHLAKMLQAMKIAVDVRTLHSERTPLQLQSQQYALLQHRLACSGMGEIDVLRAREDRRRIFTRDNPPHYHALLTESSLLRAPGGSDWVVKQQAQHLLELLDLYSQFSLQIIHMRAKLAFIDTDFTLLKMPPKQVDMVYVPYGLDGKLIKDKLKVDEREGYWNTARKAALSEDESKKIIHDLAQYGKIL